MLAQPAASPGCGQRPRCSPQPGAGRRGSAARCSCRPLGRPRRPSAAPAQQADSVPRGVPRPVAGLTGRGAVRGVRLMAPPPPDLPQQERGDQPREGGQPGAGLRGQVQAHAQTPAARGRRGAACPGRRGLSPPGVPRAVAAAELSRAPSAPVSRVPAITRGLCSCLAHS